MSQDTALPRPFRRPARVAAPAALALAAALSLAGCGNTTNVAAPAVASASGPATNSAAVTSAICAKVESAWADFVPNGTYTVGEKRLTSGKVIQVYKIDYSAYRRVSVGLYGALTGNREYQLAHDVDVLASSADDVFGDPGQSMSPKPDLATFKKASTFVAKDCGTTLEVPA